MNIFIREIKAHRKSLILWSIGILLMIAGAMGKYSAYSGSGQSMNELLSQIPETIKAALGMGNFDLTKISGFYGMSYLYLLLMATIHASMIGENIISKEERDKTTEFLMVKPVSRARILTQKLMAAFFNVFMFNIITLLLSIIIVNKYANGETITSEILILMVGMFILQLVFLSIGIGIAAGSKNPKASAFISTTVLIVTFILSAVIDMNKNLQWMKYIIPFKYFQAEKIISSGRLDILSVILSFIIIVAMLCSTYVFYKRRDLNV